MGSTTLTIELDVEVEFDYTPGTEDVMYLPNGDPGYPGEAPEMTVTRVYMRAKQGVKGLMAITRLYKRSESEGIIDLIDCLTDDDIRAIEDDIIENWEEEEPDYEQ